MSRRAMQQRASNRLSQPHTFSPPPSSSPSSPDTFDDDSPVSSLASAQGHRRSRLLTHLPTLNGVVPPGVDPEELGTIAERDKNRALLKDLYERFLRKEKEWEQFAEATQTRLQQMVDNHDKKMADMMKLHSKAEQETEQKIVILRQQNRELTQHCELLSQQNQRLKQEMESSISTISLQNQQLKSQSDLLARQNRELKMELRQEAATKFEELKKLAKDSSKTPEERLMHFERRSIQTECELQNLRATMLQSGLLRPPMPVEKFTEEEVEARPPVGKLDLGEDVFTARLLMRLGFMKAKREKLADAGSGSDDCRSLMVHSDSDDDFLNYNSEADSNVAGIYVPEDIEVGSKKYYKVTYGWITMCIVTTLVQLTALSVMIIYSLSGEGCFEVAPEGRDWWFLHVSKGLAMLIAAVLMGRQLMDVVNYLTVAELMLTERSLEVMFTAALRIIVTLVIVGANIVVFRGLTNPADVWMNMTAFAFISSIASDLMDVSKAGVFGHDIQRFTTEMSFELFFMELYPPWFHTVRMVALMMCAIAVAVFSFTTFYLPDPVCT